MSRSSLLKGVLPRHPAAGFCPPTMLDSLPHGHSPSRLVLGGRTDHLLACRTYPQRVDTEMLVGPAKMLCTQRRGRAAAGLSKPMGVAHEVVLASEPRCCHD
jgi:hypothetical protein